MGTVELKKPGKTLEEETEEPVKSFSFDTVYDWK